MNYLGILQLTQTLTEALMKLLEASVQIITISAIVLSTITLGIIIWLCIYQPMQPKR